MDEKDIVGKLVDSRIRRICQELGGRTSRHFTQSGEQGIFVSSSHLYVSKYTTAHNKGRLPNATDLLALHVSINRWVNKVNLLWL